MSVWDYYGKRDPFYGVMSAPEFRTRGIGEAALERFFSSGKTDVTEAVAAAQRAFGPLRFATALDYGCGVGRLTKPLAELFSRVIAVDLSPHMLERTRQTVEGGNVSFELANSMTEERTNFILSRMVFQHIPPKVGMPVLSRLAARLDGIGIVELPIRDKASRSWRLLRFGKRTAKRLLPFLPPTIPMYVYELERAASALHGCAVRTERFDTPMFECVRLIFHRSA